MDMTVEGFKEVAGPLGGISVEYVIKVSTSLPEYCGALHRDWLPITFTVSKTFRELEFFFKKIKAKHPNAKINDLCVHDSLFSEDKDERQKVADVFLKDVSQNSALAASSLLFNFLGYQPAKEIEVRPTKQIPKSASDDHVDIFDDFLSAKQEKEVKIQPIKKNSENIFTVDSDDDKDDGDLFADFKSPNDQGTAALFADNQSRSVKNQPLFQQQDFGGPLQKHEAKYVVPPEAMVEDVNKTESSDIEDIAALLRIDDSLSDIFGEIQNKNQSVPSTTLAGPVASSSTPPTKPRPKPKPSLPPKPMTVPATVHATATTHDKRLPTPSPRPTGMVTGASPGATGGTGAVRPVPPPRTTLPTKSGAVIASPNSAPAKPVRQASPSNQRTPVTAAVTQPTATGNDLSDVDILSYIQSEQEAALDTSLDLF